MERWKVMQGWLHFVCILEIGAGGCGTPWHAVSSMGGGAASHGTEALNFGQQQVVVRRGVKAILLVNFTLASGVCSIPCKGAHTQVQYNCMTRAR